MLIGVPKEIKNNEYRVGLTPSSVHELIHHNHSILVESAAGHGIGMTDEDYRPGVDGTRGQTFPRAAGGIHRCRTVGS